MSTFISSSSLVNPEIRSTQGFGTQILPARPLNMLRKGTEKSELSCTVQHKGAPGHPGTVTQPHSPIHRTIFLFFFFFFYREIKEKEF
jgi:hypothetical protein